MSSITYPNLANAVSYNYDDLDRLQSIPGFVTSYSYDGDNKLLEMVFGNGIANDYLYDQNARPTTISVGPSGSLLNLNYSYYPNGNIKQIDSDCYNYDGLNRLTWAGDSFTAQTGNGTDWSYDVAGNMASKESYLSGAGQGNISFSNDLANRLWSMGSTAYTNDAAGNRSGRTDTDTWSYSYDGENRLTQVVKDGSTILQNGYDGNGMRIKNVENGQTTYYVFLGNNPLMEYSAATGNYTYFIYSGDKMIAEETNGVVKYHHSDHLGSTRLVTDTSGNVVATYKFNPYGDTNSYSGSFNTEYQFTGKSFDSGVGLSYYGARWYDPETGRFITQDPAKQGLNYYVYANDNPLRYIDPTGLCDCNADDGPETSGYTGSRSGMGDNSGDNSNDPFGFGLSNEAPMTFPAYMGTLSITISLNQGIDDQGKHNYQVNIDAKGEITISENGKAVSSLSLEADAIKAAITFARSKNISLGDSVTANVSIGGDVSVEGIAPMFTVTFENHALNESIDVAVSLTKADIDASKCIVTCLPAKAFSSIGAALGGALGEAEGALSY